MRTCGLLRRAPAPAVTANAQRKSAEQAPSPTRHADQKPPPCWRGSNPRRIISALTGPGGHATDQPSMKPLTKVDVIVAEVNVEGLKRYDIAKLQSDNVAGGQALKSCTTRRTLSL